MTKKNCGFLTLRSWRWRQYVPGNVGKFLPGHTLSHSRIFYRGKTRQGADTRIYQHFTASSYCRTSTNCTSTSQLLRRWS
jgi:hypothetical protein